MTDQVIRLKDRLVLVADNQTDSTPPAGALGQMCADNSRAPRKLSSLPGYLRVSGKARMINCKITDMSATGACLKVIPSDRNITENVADYPDDVTLFIIFDKISVECEIIWRKEDQGLLGLQFRSQPRPTS